VWRAVRETALLRFNPRRNVGSLEFLEGGEDLDGGGLGEWLVLQVEKGEGVEVSSRNGRVHSDRTRSISRADVADHGKCV